MTAKLNDLILRCCPVPEFITLCEVPFISCTVSANEDCNLYQIYMSRDVVKNTYTLPFGIALYAIYHIIIYTNIIHTVAIRFAIAIAIKWQRLSLNRLNGSMNRVMCLQFY